LPVALQQLTGLLAHGIGGRDSDGALCRAECSPPSPRGSLRVVKVTDLSFSFEPEADNAWRVFYRVKGKVVTIELIEQKEGNVLLIGRKEFKP